MTSNTNHRTIDVSIFDEGPVCIFRWDCTIKDSEDFPVTFVTNNVRKILGYTPEEMITGPAFNRLIHPDDVSDVLGTLDEYGEDKSSQGFTDQYRIRRKDGQYIWVSDHTQILYDDAGNPVEWVGYISDINDIVEEREKIEALRIAKLSAERSDLSKSEFLANMSHEIRTPMNGIMGMAELLQHSQLGPREADFVNIINRSGEALLTIINDILDFSKIASGHMELDENPFHLRTCIEDITALLATRITETGIDLLVRIKPDLPSCYLGDVGRIRQILTNIVGNAVKFTNKGHVLIDVSGQVENETAKLTIKIIDTGIGIPPEKLGHIFNKFNQADNSTTRQYGGTGLGLTISKDLAELMGGTIAVESSVGEGSTFTVSINLPVEAETIKKKLESLNISGSKVLVIDDNEVNRDILKEQLTYWGCQCIAAPSTKVGLTVLDRAKQKNIKLDLIIVDYQMPESNGEDFVRALNAHPDHAHIPAIMLSSVDRTELRQRMQALNISAFLTKPARGSVLHNTIGDVLCGRSTQQAPVPSVSLELTTRPDEPVASGHIDILIAEDNEVNQLYASYVMEDLGLSFKIVPNGQLAVDEWKLLSPKAILMDISMPKMNGWEATAAIRAIESAQNLPRTPIIAVTAHAMKSDKDECLEKDMDDYLSKPLSITALKEKLIHWGVMEANTGKNAKITA